VGVLLMMDYLLVTFLINYAMFFLIFCFLFWRDRILKDIKVTEPDEVFLMLACLFIGPICWPIVVGFMLTDGSEKYTLLFDKNLNRLRQQSLDFEALFLEALHKVEQKEELRNLYHKIKREHSV
jgi:hypothetical protein